jgi:hypothetical protein
MLLTSIATVGGTLASSAKRMTRGDRTANACARPPCFSQSCTYALPRLDGYPKGWRHRPNGPHPLRGGCTEADLPAGTLVNRDRHELGAPSRPLTLHAFVSQRHACAFKPK